MEFRVSVQRPFAKKRPLGPFLQIRSGDRDIAPEVSDDFKPPKVVNSFGDEDWYRDFIDRDPRSDSSNIEPKPEDQAVGMYDVERDIAIVDNMRFVDHHAIQTVVMENRMNALPLKGISGDLRESTLEVPKMENILPFKFIYADFPNEEGLRPSLDIPTSAGSLHDPPVLVKSPTIDQLYKCVWPMRVIDLPPDTMTGIKYEKRFKSVDQRIKLGLLYKELEFIGELPEPKIDRPVI